MLSEIDAACAVVAVSGLGLALSAARDLRAAGEYTDEGLLSWKVIEATQPMRRPRAIAWLMPWKRYQAVLSAKFAAGLVAPGALLMPPGAAAALACVLAATALLTLYRSSYGLDGSDQMFVLDTLAAAGALVAGGTVGRLFLGFLAAQLTLSYLIAGTAKLVSRTWRDGSCLGLILSMDAYSSPRLALALRTRPVLAATLAWGVMLFEVTFWVAPVFHGTVMWLFLAGGVALHLGIAVSMGLTTFLFAFPAAYPALVYATAA